jgi:nitronate monooxygenase
LTEDNDVSGLLASLGARLPVVAAPMAGGPSTPALVVSVARAGGLGFLAGGYKTNALLAEQITAVRRRTALFGVNLFVPNIVPLDPTAFHRYAEELAPLAGRYDIDLLGASPVEDDDDWEAKVALLEKQPAPVVSFTFGLPPTDVVRRLQRVGSRVVQTVTSPDEARQAAEIGVDGLVVQGCHAGGHSGTFNPAEPVRDVPLDALVGSVRDEVQLPLWAAGGLSSAADVDAVRSAGAEAAVVGTVLLRTPESGATTAYKTGLADPGLTETVMTRAFSGRPARGLLNEFIVRYGEKAPLGYPAIHHLTSPIRKAAAAAGDFSHINLWAGSGFARATQEPAGEILRRLAGVQAAADPASH